MFKVDDLLYRLDPVNPFGNCPTQDFKRGEDDVLSDVGRVGGCGVQHLTSEPFA
ncbi:hypothetical protein AB0M46_21620 [Dactylosporangium sp. NPDC051485]|uniref:hypothetical protein n=1 Tax=Dactylosporangium sp. NPDC051485 TaxID=3154846 RepID=UPI003447486B